MTSTTPNKSKRNREAEVVAAAIDVFAQKGYRGASIQDVADKVGVLKGSLYYYIDSKADLLWWIIDDVHSQSTAILSDVQELDASSLDRIWTFIARHVEWYLDNVKEVSVFFREWRSLDPKRLALARKRRHEYERRIRELITAAQESGDISPDIDPKYASFYVLAAVNSVPDWYRRTGGDTAAEIAEQYADMTVGLLVGTGHQTKS